MALRRAANKQELAFTASRLGTFGLAAATSVVLARVLGPTQFGTYAGGAAMAGIVLLLGAWGVDQLFLAHTISEIQLRRRLSQVGVLSGAAVLAAAIVWPGISKDLRICLGLIGLGMVCDIVRLPFLLEPQQRLQFATRGRRELALRLVGAGVVVLAAIFTRSATTVAAAALAASAVLLLTTNPGVWRVREAWSGGRMELIEGIGFGLSGALYTLYYQVDMALLASLSSVEQVAVYRAAYSFMNAAVVIPVVLNVELMRPQLFRAAIEPNPMRPIAARYGTSSALAGLVVGALLLLFSNHLILWLFGHQFSNAIFPLQLLALAIPFNFTNSWCGNLLMGRHRVRAVLGVQAAVAVLNIAGNVVLIPAFGAEGAALMTVISEAVASGFYVGVLLMIRRCAP